MEVGDRESQEERHWQCPRSEKLGQNDAAADADDHDYVVYDDADDTKADYAADTDDYGDGDDSEAADETHHSGPAKDEKRQRRVSDSEAGNERGDEASDPENQADGMWNPHCGW